MPASAPTTSDLNRAHETKGAQHDGNGFKKKALIWIVYFVILLVCALPRGLDTPVPLHGFTTANRQDMPRMSNLADVVSYYGDGDAGIYARMATHLSQGNFTDYEYWRLRLFAPGNIFIEAACAKLFGPNFPIVLFFTFLVCASWASVIFNVWALGNHNQKPILRFALPLLILSLGLFRTYFINKGVVLSESLSTAQIALGFLFTLRAIREKQPRIAILGGICLAFAAYVRAQNELVCLALTICGVAIAAVLFVWHTLQKQSETFLQFVKSKPALIAVVVALTIFNALTIPYRCWNIYQYKSASWLQWDHYWEANWRDENLMRTRDHDQGLIDTGETVAGRVDPVLAASIQKEVNAKGPFAFADDYYKRNSIMTFVLHPLKWLKLKFPAARNAWKDGTDPTGKLHLEHLLYLSALAFCTYRFLFVSLISKKLRNEELWNFLFFFTLLSANALTTIFIHLEGRYFYTLKMTAVVLLLVYAISNIGGKKSAEIEKPAA